MKKIFIFLILLTFVFSLNSTHAQIPGEGLTISPPLTELTLKPGETVSQMIKITNPTEKLVEVYPVIMNFHAKGETGEPTFTAATDEEAKFALAKWIKFNQTKLALTPEQVGEFNYQIEVPLGAEPGGHYGVVFFATEPPKPEGDVSQVAIASMIGSLILVKVPGNIIEKGLLEEFSAKRFYFKPPVNITTRISNLGNVHFKPKGEISIKGWFGKKENLTVNESKGNILPDSIRRFDNKWPAPGFWTIGRFSADLRLVYGESEKTLIGRTVFWIIPWWLIIAVIILLFIIILIIVLIRRRRKKKKERQVEPSLGPERIIIR